MAGAPVSQYVRGLPAAPLRPFIRWYSGYREVGVLPAVHRGLPSPYLTVIVTLDDPLDVAAHPDPAAPPDRYDSLVGGLHTTPALIVHNGRQSGIQLAMSPLGARALLGMPAGELAGIDVHGVDVLGPCGELLRERVLAAPGWAARFAVLDEFLLRRLDANPAGRPRPEVVRAWCRLVGTGGAEPVAALARDVGWSARHLSGQFATEIGLSPKAAARVVRFDAARRALQGWLATGRDLTLAELAAACGYFDQAHLARDFTAFAGCPPSRWLREEFRNVQAAAAGAVPDSPA
jgi:AraC-like DNA-binding protein